MLATRRRGLAALAIVAAVSAALAMALPAAGEAAQGVPGLDGDGPDAGRVAGRGDLLAPLEWGPGSADAALAFDRKAWVFAPRDPSLRQPTHVFGVEFSTRSPPAKKVDADQDAALLGAALVRAYARPGASGTDRLLEEYEKFLSRNGQFVQTMRDLFVKLDTNRDQAIDAGEIGRAVNEGQVSVVGGRVLRSFDVNLSGRVSWQEFRLSPLLIAALEAHPFLLEALRTNQPGVENRLARLYRATLGSYYVTRPAATGLIELGEGPADADSQAVPSTGAAAAAAAAEAAADAAAATAGGPGAPREEEDEQHQQGPDVQGVDGEPRFAEAGERDQAAVQARVLEHLGLRQRAESEHRREEGFGDFLKSAVSTVGNLVKKVISPTPSAMQEKQAPKTAAEKAKIDRRYKSVFGVPKEVDEECVMCQFVVELAKHDMVRLGLDNAVPNDRYPTAAARRGVEDPRIRLVEERGMRSAVRRNTNVLTAVMKRVCGETAPYLFRTYCADLWSQRRQLAYGLARKLSPPGVCMIAKPLCNRDTYLYSDVSVHAPAMSNRFNGARGLCGLIGGPKAREGYEGTSSISCFAAKVANSVGIGTAARFADAQDGAASASASAPAPADGSSAAPAPMELNDQADQQAAQSQTPQ